MAIYLKNKELVDEVLKYQETNIQTEKLYNYYKLLVSNLSRVIYINNKDKYDVIQDTILFLITKTKKYDYNKSKNAFSYFTQIAKNNMYRLTKDYNKYNLIEKI